MEAPFNCHPTAPSSNDPPGARKYFAGSSQRLKGCSSTCDEQLGAESLKLPAVAAEAVMDAATRLSPNPSPMSSARRRIAREPFESGECRSSHFGCARGLLNPHEG